MNLKRMNYLGIIAGIIFLLASCGEKIEKKDTKKVPVSVSFSKHTIKKYGDFKGGDNWCQTWAADDNIYTFLDDGFGFNRSKFRFNNVPVRISGEPNNFIAKELTDGYPEYEFGGGYYGYGMISVDSTIYAFLSSSEIDGFSYFHGNKLFYSEDFGKTWYNHNGNPATEEKTSTDKNQVFFWHEDPVMKDSIEGYAFSWISFCQNGKNNMHAEEISDPYVYLYSPEPDECWKMNMARVHKNQIKDKSAYEYFKGYDQNNNPTWTPNIKQRGCVYEFPYEKDWGWYSWLPSVVWNEDLGLYIMVNYGSRYGKSKGKFPGNYWNSYMHDKTCSIGFWYAENPWGPWKQIYYNPLFFTSDLNDRIYQPKLSPKWIKNSGKTMHLIWSDARDGWTTNYLWNQMEINFDLK